MRGFSSVLCFSVEVGVGVIGAAKLRLVDFCRCSAVLCHVRGGKVESEASYVLKTCVAGDIWVVGLMV